MISAYQSLRQLNGDIDKLQFNGIDAVTTEGIKPSGKEDVKKKRKALNTNCNTLRTKINSLADIVDTIKKSRDCEEEAKNHEQQK